MAEQLNILVIEDRNADFLMIERHLKHQGLSARCCRVDSIEGLKETVNTGKWDLVLSDYNVPRLNFQDSLNLIKEILPDIPIILVSGTMGEEKAVELLKLGAWDFVLKDNLIRLVPAIQRSLRDAQDRSARKSTEQAREATIELLRICNQTGSLMELMQDLMYFFQKVTGCDAIGVRLRDGDDFPYYVTQGFSEKFVLAENSLCAFDQMGELIRDYAGHPAMDCMCGNVLCSRFDLSKSFFTKRGSFWSSNTTELLATTSDADRKTRTRNRCNSEGYESVALIPLRYRDETYGLFQFNDRKKGRFTSSKIALYEELVDYVAIALAKLKSDDDLRESNERFRMIFEHSIDAIMLTKTDGTVLSANPEACRIFGMSEEDICRAGRTGLVEMGDAKLNELLEHRSRTGQCRGEIIMIRGDGSRFPAEISSAVFTDREGVKKTSLVIRDVTERKSLEHQLLQAQKMEAVGTLAGGIAHDFNNILTAIVGYSSLLQMEVKRGGKPQEYIDNLMALVERAANLTRGLLAFSRNQVMTPKLINLNEVVTTITKLLSRLIGENIEVEMHLSSYPLSIMADCGQIEQVLMNLATNARDAMPSGGQLVISTDVVTLGPENPLLTDFNPPGQYALVSVADTGCGMDEATIARIFEPFFTTKEIGKGTGLGLSILYGIIKQHHGFVTVASNPGSGTTIGIHIPLADPVVAQASDKASMPVQGGTETILIVEDDPEIRTVLNHILQQFGYSVLKGADGDEAVAIFRENSAEISLVILDTIMPRKNGIEAYDLITRIKPGVKALFISGYPADIIAQRGLLPEGVSFLPKPVSPMDLLRNIRQILSGQGAESK